MGRQQPGASPSRSRGSEPSIRSIALRISRRVGKPMAAVMRRTCRLRPSCSSSSNQVVGMLRRSRIGGCRGAIPSRCLGGSCLTRAGRLNPSLSWMPCRNALSARSLGIPSTWTQYRRQWPHRGSVSRCCSRPLEVSSSSPSLSASRRPAA